MTLFWVFFFLEKWLVTSQVQKNHANEAMMICRGVIYPTNCSKMFTVHGLTGKQRLILGLVVLFLVDIIWVGSAELTEVRFCPFYWILLYYFLYCQLLFGTVYCFVYSLVLIRLRYTMVKKWRSQPADK